ncbi:MAG: hypothetical protein IH897_08860, partial [Planctomycetes bacterium]|nr:hypothetical protein [Planctomycetota bacterium]
GSCFISEAGSCRARAGSFGGARSICEGDADGDGIDDACDDAVVPAVSTWGMIALILTLCTAMAIKFAVPRRRAIG